MFPIISHWTFIGTIYLIWLTYQDFKYNMEVDDRKNYFMMGLTFSFLSMFNRSWIYIISLIIFVILFNTLSKKFNLVGHADISTMNWVIFGLAYINPFFLGYFMIILTFLSLIYMFFKEKVYKIKNNVPYYPIILFSFVLVSAFFGLY